MVTGVAARRIYSALTVTLFVAIQASAEAAAMDPEDPPISGGDGETWGYCGDLVVFGGLILGEIECAFTINVQVTSLNKYMWWVSELEPMVKFNWRMEATAMAPGGVPRTFFFNWTGGALQQDQPAQMIRQLTLDRIGVWSFTGHWIPSDPTGTRIVSPDIGWWDLKACVDPSPNQNACIANTPNPSPI